MQVFTNLALIFFTVFILIILARIILMFLINRAYKRYLKLKKISQKIFPTAKKNFVKEEEELLRKLEIPRAHSAVKAELKEKGAHESGSYELMPSQEQQNELSQSEIVDFVKPIGFWTSMILGQKLTYLVQSAQMLNKRGNKGFWVSMIEAKDRVAGKQHSRGR